MKDIKQFFATTTGKVISIVVILVIGISIGGASSGRSNNSVNNPAPQSANQIEASTTNNPVTVQTDTVTPVVKKTVTTKAVVSAPAPVSTPVPTAPAPVVTVVAPTLSWHTAYTYSGHGGIKTPLFSLQGNKQRIDYQCSVVDPSNPYGADFNGIITAPNGYPNDVFAGLVDCPINKSTYEYSLSPNQYYLNLDGSNSSYSVTVEDYY